MLQLPGRPKLLLPVVVVLSLGVLILARSEEDQPKPRESPPVETKPAEPKPEAKAPVSAPKAPVAETAAAEESPGETLAVAPPPFTPGIFPCSGCHEELTPNPTQRQLKKRHKEIVLKHDEGNRWCLDCHTLGNIDKLHLASGKTVEFTESYKLCGQCHGPTLRDWKAGEHGKRTGSWDGQKQYYLCASCHNPHAPKFAPLKPLPPPVRPRDIR